ncbi:MAG: glycosyltransferase family 9 protein [Verrucomicrobiales bacterium]|nr:glycosyltransferase family 9 protein [Verrucomicrobiales bacterium]
MKTSANDSDFSRFFAAGNEAFGRGEFENSIRLYSRAHQLNSGHAVLLANIAATLYELGQFDESEIFARQSISRSPNYNRPHITLGMLRLLQGDFANGWREYEWVATLAEKFRSMPPEREWKGENLQGTRIVVIDEQGYGDTLQFIRFAARLVNRGAEVFLDVKAPLRRLLAGNPHLGKVLYPGDPNEYSKWTRLLSIPAVLEEDENTIGRPERHLQPPPLPFRSRINKCAGRKIGLIWKGSASNSRDANRSLSVSDFAPVFCLADRFPDLHFFHLHNLPFTAEIAAAGLTDRLIEMDGEMKDFADLAAIIEAMDLVVTIDTAVAHLAGALGKRTLCLLSFVPDWRWEIGKEQSTWYPKTRLIRQPAQNDWHTPIKETAQYIASWAEKRATVR